MNYAGDIRDRHWLHRENQVRPDSAWETPIDDSGELQGRLRHLAVPSPTVIVGRTRGWRGALSGFKSEVWRS
jgi:hypothetical protein